MSRNKGETPKIRILFVCHGMCEFVMKKLVADRGLADKYEIASAATTTEEIWGGRGNPVYPPAKRKLAEHGIRCDGKRAVLMTRDDYDRYDYLIGMDGENLRDMRRICGGDPEGKISLLMDYTDRPGSVADPWYTRNFDVTWGDVLAGCQGLLKYLQK